MAAPATTLTAIRYRLVDVSATNPNLVSTTTLQSAVDQALAHFNRDRPRMVVEDETGLTSPYIPVVGTGAVLQAWSDQFSRIVKFEYPARAVAVGYVPQYLEEGADFEVGYQDATKTYIRMITSTPAAGEILRFTYTARHTHDTGTDTVPPAHLEALYDLGAHFGCLQLATKAAASNDPLINADSVNHRDSQLKFKQQADAWLQAYKDKMGIGTDKDGSSAARGASAVADWDSTLQGGRPHLTHWSRRR